MDMRSMHATVSRRHDDETAGHSDGHEMYGTVGCLRTKTTIDAASGGLM
jgi:hypothetical protein